MTHLMNKQEIYSQLAHQVAGDELRFPTGAQVALKLSRMLDDPDCHISAAAKLIRAEPLLSTRIIAVSNSVLYNHSTPDITDVHMAVALLGLRTTRTLAMALVTRQMAGNSPAPERRALANKLWEHSAHVAALAHAIARHVTHLDPETAMFAGIIHEIGGFYMLSRTEEFPGLLEGDFTEWLEDGEITVSRALLARLGAPEAVTDAIETFWSGFLSMPPETLADTLLLAERLAPVPSPLYRLKSGTDDGELSAKIEIVIGEETLSLILTESRKEISSLVQALQF